MSVSPRLSTTFLLALLVVSAGCVGILTGDEPLTIESSPVSVSASAQSETGYEEARTTTKEITREFSAAGQTREVEVTNHIAEYSRTVDAGPLGSGEFARFVVVSTPAVELFDQTFNPVGEMSNRDLIELVQDQYQDLENVQPVGERTMTVLGSSTTVSTFSAEATVQGTDRTIDLTLHVTRVKDGDDFIVAIGAHPAILTGETDRINRLLSGIQHAE